MLLRLPATSTIMKCISNETWKVMLSERSSVWLLFSRQRMSTDVVQNIYENLSAFSSTDQWREAGRQLMESYTKSPFDEKRSLLIELCQKFGVDHQVLKRSIELYHKNEATIIELNKAVRPQYYRLFTAVANIRGGVKKLCDMRADILQLLSTPNLSRLESSALRLLESHLRELLTLWFCLSSLHVMQLTPESPGDILSKVMKYEAVHPMQGLEDMQQRLGLNRRCYVFMHEAMAQEPLVVVYAAFMNKIARTLEEINDVAYDKEPESTKKIAVFYSISSTQAGLRGIDLGKMLIKHVIAEISRTNPHINVFSTLSPLPHFRSWVLRSLKGAAPSGDVVDERLMMVCEENDSFKGDSETKDSVRLFLLDRFNKVDFKKFEEVSEIIMHLAVRYLIEIKHSGSFRAFDPVENFHLRNGAEIYKVVWKADTNQRTLETSFGLMVNYRYRLDQLAKNSAHYISAGEIAVNSNTLISL